MISQPIIMQSPNQKSRLKGLYAITDSSLLPEEIFFSMVEQALKGGARVIQFRDKREPDSVMLEKAVVLRGLCKRYGAIFIVNDHVELAVEAEAHGVHVGEDDTDIFHVRKSIKKGIIGVSCYNDIGRALKMADTGADYVALGSFFPSPTKPGARHADLKLLAQARALLNIPICAIGGITVESARALAKSGADMIAVISDLWTAPDVKERAFRYAGIFSGLTNLRGSSAANLKN